MMHERCPNCSSTLGACVWIIHMNPYQRDYDLIPKKLLETCEQCSVRFECYTKKLIHTVGIKCLNTKDENKNQRLRKVEYLNMART